MASKIDVIERVAGRAGADFIVRLRHTRSLAFLNWLLWSSGPKSDGWRPHIDGLRAIAVLAVLLYHSGVIDISGGFIGVDVFFVISGFLISKVIYDDIATHGKFRIVNFYERRARRILPVFTVVTAAAVIAGYFLFLPDQFAVLGRSAIYACGFAANIFFYLSADYFGPAANTQPLLHYWSLGVEEQFYIVFPVVVLAILRFAPRLLGVTFLTIGLASFLLAEMSVRTEPTAAFYLTPQRAWELLAGGILVLPGFPYLQNRLLREAIAAVGLALICLAALKFSSATPFPGLTAAVPVAGTAFILWACEGSPTLVGALLSIKPLRQVGLWSYSIYMIHWPIIVYTHVMRPHVVFGQSSGIVVASIALGCLSYFFVEMPFRKPHELLSRQRLFVASFASLLAMTGLGFSIASTNGFPQRLPEPVRRILAYNQYDIGSLYRQHTCFISSQIKQDLQPECLPSGRPSALLWGDSFAAHYYAALQARFPNVVIQQASMAGCAPIVRFSQFDLPYCGPFNDMILNWAVAERPDRVILSAEWPTDDVSFFSKLDAMVKSLRAANLPVIIIGLTPAYVDTVPNILARRLLRGNHNVRAEDEFTGAQFMGDYLMKPRFAGLDGVRYISSGDTVCMESACPLVTESGVPIQWDAHGHLTREGASLFVNSMFADGFVTKASK